RVPQRGAARAGDQPRASDLQARRDDALPWAVAEPQGLPQPARREDRDDQGHGTGRSRQREGPRVSAGGDSGRSYAVAVLPGDGIGPEVIDEAEATLQAVAEQCGFGVTTERFEVGAQRVLDKGEPMDPALPDELRRFDAILCGPVGDPRVH